MGYPQKIKQRAFWSSAQVVWECRSVGEERRPAALEKCLVAVTGGEGRPAELCLGARRRANLSSVPSHFRLHLATTARPQLSLSVAEPNPSNTLPLSFFAMPQAQPELKKYLDKRLFVQLNGSRKVIGVLRGYDVSLVPRQSSVAQITRITSLVTD